jgi:SAM-dependent methyltransferase
MRSKDLPRLSDIHITKSNLNYLHYSYFHRDVINAIRQYAKGKVIDIGCGNKPYEKIFEGKIAEYVGCDIVQSSLQKVDIICDAIKIPLTSCEFDTVFSTQTIEHIAEFQLVFDEAYRILKPGGYFILSGPMYWPLHEEPYDYFRFTKYGYEFTLKKSGFEIEKVYANGGMWATCGQSFIHSFMNSKTKFLPIRICRFLFFKLRLYWIHNLFFAWLDKVDFNPINTMNYVVVAKK